MVFPKNNIPVLTDNKLESIDRFRKNNVERNYIYESNGNRKENR